MQQVGVLSGEVKPNLFNVLLSDSSIGNGSFVKIKHDVYGWVLARIGSMKRYIDDFDEEIILARAQTVGYRSEDGVLFPKTPFKPDEKVYLADKELITSILGLKNRREGSIYLGLLEGQDIPVYLDVKKTTGKHVSVLAKTGAGKSYTVGVILEELLKCNIPIVVIDPHGEYGSLRYENDEYDLMIRYGVKVNSYAKQIVEYVVNQAVNPDAKKLTLKSSFDLQELIDIMPMKLNDKQKSIVYEALRGLDGRDYTIFDLIDLIKHEGDNKSGWKVLSGLETLRDSGVFSGRPVTEKELVKTGVISIINLKGVDPNIQELIVAKISTDLFNARRLNKIPEFFFLVEESHNFCPERGFGDAISSNILRMIASEGRKFGFHLCVVSQRPARVDKNILSQCNTQIILKVTNPNDLRAISQSIEGFMLGMEDEIKELPVGHALIVGDCVEQPVTVDIRVRETKHGGIRIPVKKLKPPPKEVLPVKRVRTIDAIKKFFLKDESELKAELEKKKLKTKGGLKDKSGGGIGVSVKGLRGVKDDEDREETRENTGYEEKDSGGEEDYAEGEYDDSIKKEEKDDLELPKSASLVKRKRKKKQERGIIESIFLKGEEGD